MFGVEDHSWHQVLTLMQCVLQKLNMRSWDQQDVGRDSSTNLSVFWWYYWSSLLVLWRGNIEILGWSLVEVLTYLQWNVFGTCRFSLIVVWVLCCNMSGTRWNFAHFIKTALVNICFMDQMDSFWISQTNAGNVKQNQTASGHSPNISFLLYRAGPIATTPCFD